MKKKTYLILLKGFIVLSPIPFGCVGRVFSPLFYLLLFLIAFSGYSVIEQKKISGTKSVLFAFKKKVTILTVAFFGFILFQIIPLPLFLVKLISPVTVESFEIINMKIPGFIPLSYVPLETVMFGFRLVGIILFFSSFIRIEFRKREIISIMNVLVFSVSLQSLFGLIKYATGNRNFFLFFHRVTEDPTAGFLTGTLGNPNHFSFYIEMIFPLLLALFFMKIKLFGSGGSIREKVISAFNADRNVILKFILLPFLGLAIILTGSRAGIMTLLISFVIFSMLTIYLRRSKLLRKKLKIIFLTLAMVTIFFGIKNTTDKFMKGDYLSSSGRFLRWPSTMEMFKDHPLSGTGLGTYKYSYYLYDRDMSGVWSTHAHNEYLELLSEGGVIGAGLLLCLIGFLVHSISKMWRARRHPEIKILGIGVLTSIFAALFHSFFDFSLRIPSNTFVLILMIGLGVQLTTYKKEFADNGMKVRSREKVPEQASGGELQ